MDKYIEAIIPEFLMAEKITKDGATYSIVSTDVQDGNLYVALANLEEGVKLYGREAVQEELDHMGVVRTKFLGEWNWCLKPTVIEIRNPYLRSFRGLHRNCKYERDYTQIHGTGELFKVSTFAADKSIFFKDCMPVKDISELNFPEEITGLRKIIAKALPDSLAAKYAQEIKTEYLQKMLIINNEFIERIKDAVQKAGAESEAVISLYIKATNNQKEIASKLIAQQEGKSRQ